MEIHLITNRLTEHPSSHTRAIRPVTVTVPTPLLPQRSDQRPVRPQLLRHTAGGITGRRGRRHGARVRLEDDVVDVVDGEGVQWDAVHVQQLRVEHERDEVEAHDDEDEEADEDGDVARDHDGRWVVEAG